MKKLLILLMFLLCISCGINSDKLDIVKTIKIGAHIKDLPDDFILFSERDKFVDKVEYYYYLGQSLSRDFFAKVTIKDNKVIDKELYSAPGGFGSVRIK